MISRHQRTVFATAAPLFSLVLFVGGCSKKDAGHASAAPPPPTVVVEKIDQRTVPIYSEYVGQTRADETVELRARVEGILQKVYFREGANIRKGQLLFTIDKRAFEANVQSAKAALAKSTADLAQAKQRTDVIKAQAELADTEATYSKTQSDLARVAPLAKEKAVTELELDAAVAAEKSAKEKRNAAQANLTNLEASVKYTIERAQAEVSAAQARLIQAQLDLSYCDIYSPINGVIGFLQVDEGNLVGRGDATLLATVSLANPLLVDFNLSEVEYLKLTDRNNPGSRASKVQFKLILSDDSVHPEPGSFKVLDRSVDPATGTMRARGVFSNADHGLSPGFFGRIRIPGSGKYQALLIPDRALGSDQAQKFVYVVNGEKKVEFRPVKIGPIIDGLRVVKEGLKPGEQIIVEGLLRVRPGVAVDAKLVEAK